MMRPYYSSASTIFTTRFENGALLWEPRQDATIQVEDYTVVTAESGIRAFRPVRLLEYHPDLTSRKFRGYAFIEHEEWMDAHEAYDIQGKGYLDTPFVYIREFMIHSRDRAELTVFCQRHLGGQPLAIHPQPCPFPIFEKGDRVVVIAYKDAIHDMSSSGPGKVNMIGKTGTIAMISSKTGQSCVIFDDKTAMRGFQSMGLPSVALRKVEDVHV